RRLDGLATGQLTADMAIGREEPREVALDHVGLDQTVTTYAQARRDTRTFADNRDAGLQIAWLRPIRARVAPLAEADVGADDDVLVEDRSIDDAARADDAIREQDAVAHDGALGHEHARRQHRVLDRAVDDRTVRDQATDDLAM